MKETFSAAVRFITPPVIWDAYLRLRGLGQNHPWRQFKKMATCADATPLFKGKFAKIHNKYRALNPFAADTYRYLHYNVCYFASLCRHVPGDFVCAGVSFGATAKIVYEFVDFPTLGKTLHLIDPLEGIVAKDSNRVSRNYNRDSDYVLRQYPPGSPIVHHRKRVPLRLPGPLAFVFTDTGNPAADAQSLPIFYEALSPGGIILTDQYGDDIELYDSVLEPIGVSPFWLPSGQGVIVKR
jgi:hypothetical protein